MTVDDFRFLLTVGQWVFNLILVLLGYIWKRQTDAVDDLLADHADTLREHGEKLARAEERMNGFPSQGSIDQLNRNILSLTERIGGLQAELGAVAAVAKAAKESSDMLVEAEIREGRGT